MKKIKLVFIYSDLLYTGWTVYQSIKWLSNKITILFTDYLYIAINH